MDINIIGPGVVGKATGEAWSRFGHNIDYTDIGEDFYSSADLYVICTPEDTVEDVVTALVEWLQGVNQLGLADIVVRSSTPPGTIARIAEGHGISLWHNPEFLREATAEQDVLHAQYTIIGYARRTKELEEVVPCEALDEIYTGMGIGPIYCTSTESEFVKLATNCYLATQISFWNELKRIADELGINSHKVAKLATLDPRVSTYGALMHGAAYGGKCLPKDMKQMRDFRLGRTPLLDVVGEINQLIIDGRWFE